MIIVILTDTCWHSPIIIEDKTALQLMLHGAEVQGQVQLEQTYPSSA